MEETVILVFISDPRSSRLIASLTEGLSRPAEFPKTSFYDTQDQKEGALASMMPPAEDDS